MSDIGMIVRTTSVGGRVRGTLSTSDDIRLGTIEFYSQEAADFFLAFLGRMAREVER